MVKNIDSIRKSQKTTFSIFKLNRLSDGGLHRRRPKIGRGKGNIFWVLICGRMGQEGEGEEGGWWG